MFKSDGDFQEETVEIDDHQIFLRKNGRGKPVFLLSGLTDLSGSGFKDLSSYLAPQGFECTTLAIPYSLPTSCQLLLTLLGKFQEDTSTGSAQEKVILIGDSFGSLIALNFAALYPQKVEKLVLCEMSVYLTHSFKRRITAKFCHLVKNSSVAQKIVKSMINSDFILKQIWSRFWPTRVWTKDFSQDEMVVNLRKLQVKAMVEVILEILENNPYEAAQKIICPTLIICGEKDRFLTPREGRNIHHQIKHSELLIVPGMKHGAFLDYLEQIQEKIAGFLLSS